MRAHSNTYELYRTPQEAYWPAAPMPANSRRLRPPRAIEGRRFTPWAARRQPQIRPDVRTKARTGNFREIPSVFHCVAQDDDARLFLRRPVMSGGARAGAPSPRHHIVVEIADGDLCHRPRLLTEHSALT